MKRCFKKGLALLMAVLMVMSTFSMIITAAPVIDYDKCQHNNVRLEVEEYHAPTCQQYGYTAVHYCYDCEEYVVLDENIIPKVPCERVYTGHVHGEDLAVTYNAECQWCGADMSYSYGDVGHENLDEFWFIKDSEGNTCTDGGYATFQCKYDKTNMQCCAVDVTLWTDPIGHDLDWKNAVTVVAPTCVTEGILNVACLTCGQTYDILMKDMEGEHNYVVELVPGMGCWAKYTCTKCGDVFYGAVDHTWVKDEGPNTCGWTCSVCGATKVVHEKEEYHYKDSSCTEYGYEFWLCLHCGEKYGYRVFDLKPHDYQPTNVVNATCTTDGSYDSICTVCGDVEATGVVIPALGHDADTNNDGLVNDADWVVEVQPTCISTGLAVLYCERCGEKLDEKVLTDIIHDQKGYERTTAPTCTAPGEVSIHCMRCGLQDYQTTVLDDRHLDDNLQIQDGDKVIYLRNGGLWAYLSYLARYDYDLYLAELARLDPTPLGHDLSKTVVGMTCVSDGYDLYTCSRCDYEYKDNFVTADPLNKQTHKHAVEIYKEGLTREPSCTLGSFRYYFCDACNTDFAVIGNDALGHDYLTIQNHLNPTCTDDGHYAEVKCSRCDAYKVENGVTLDGSVIPALGHDKVYVEKTRATCLLDGWKTGGWYCARCGLNKAELTDPAHGNAHLGVIHVKAWACGGVWDDALQAYVVDDGYTVFGCTECVNYMKDPTYYTIHYLNGNPLTPVYVVNPLYVIVEDDYKYPKYHNYVAGEYVEPTCLSNGYTPYTCECGATYNDYAAGTQLPHKNAAGVEFYSCAKNLDCYCVLHNGEVHSWVYTDYPATCVNQYKYTLKYCPVCTTEEVTNIEPDDRYTHNWVDIGWVDGIAPTIWNGGTWVEQCGWCGEYQYTWHDALAHVNFTSDLYSVIVKDGKIEKAPYDVAVNSGYVALTINMDGQNVPFWGVQMAINYDPAQVEFMHGMTADYNNELYYANQSALYAYVGGADAVSGVVNMVGTYADGYNTNYVLNTPVDTTEHFVTLIFKVNPQFFNDEIDISVEYNETIVIDKDQNPLYNFTFNSSDMPLAESKHVYKLGDIDDTIDSDAILTTDGICNILDMQVVMDMSVNGEFTNYTDVQWAVADINKDGEVTFDDFEDLRDLVVNPTDEFYFNYISK